MKIGSCKYLRHIATFYITLFIYTIFSDEYLEGIVNSFQLSKDFQDFHIAKVVEMKNAKFPSKIS